MEPEEVLSNETHYIDITTKGTRVRTPLNSQNIPIQQIKAVATRLSREFGNKRMNVHQNGAWDYLMGGIVVRTCQSQKMYDEHRIEGKVDEISLQGEHRNAITALALGLGLPEPFYHG